MMNSKKFEELNTENTKQRESSFASAEAMEDKKEEKELSLEKIPSEVRGVLNELEEQGHEAHMVGGCVRGVLRNEKPNDWDMTTNAKQEDIIRMFPRCFCENKFGTVTVVQDTPDPSLRHIEITPYRKEGKYTDKRHPDELTFGGTLEEDLGRRDFRINAMAININKDGEVEIVDPFDGQKDLKNKVISAVGNPDNKFQRDALRLMRAPRFAVRLGFKIEKDTKKSIKENAGLLSVIAKERITDEFFKILESKRPSVGIEMLRELKLFSNILPEIDKKFTNKEMKKENFPFLKKSANTDSSIESRLVLFFLDLKNIKDIDEIKFAKSSLRYLRIPNNVIRNIEALFRGNNLVNDFEKLDKPTMRRIWRTFALKDRIDDDVKKTMEDFITIQKIQGKGKRIQQNIENKGDEILETSEDPLFLNDLEVRGGDIIKELKIKPGPKVGKILNVLLEQVIENPKRNNKKYLISEAKKLYKNHASFAPLRRGSLAHNYGEFS